MVKFSYKVLTKIRNFFPFHKTQFFSGVAKTHQRDEFLFTTVRNA